MWVCVLGVVSGTVAECYTDVSGFFSFCKSANFGKDLDISVSKWAKERSKFSVGEVVFILLLCQLVTSLSFLSLCVLLLSQGIGKNILLGIIDVLCFCVSNVCAHAFTSRA